jgi:DNA-binding beta-propeller fold protein YncE
MIRSTLSQFVSLCCVTLCGFTAFFSGPINAQEMQYPLAVVKAPTGEMYVADRNLPGIWKVADGKATIYFQGSKKFRTPLNAVRCLAIGADGTLFAGDSSTREVYKFDAEGKPQPLTKGYIGIPMGIVIDSKGDLFVADLERTAVFKVPTSNGEVTEFVKCSAPRGIAIDGKDRIWILANVNDSLVRYSPDKSAEIIVKGTPFEFPNQLVLDDEENAYLCDGYAKAVWKVKVGSEPEKLISGEPLKNPVGITRDGGNLIVADPHLKSLFSIDVANKSAAKIFP